MFQVNIISHKLLLICVVIEEIRAIACMIGNKFSIHHPFICSLQSKVIIRYTLIEDLPRFPPVNSYHSLQDKTRQDKIYSDSTHITKARFT